MKPIKLFFITVFSFLTTFIFLGNVFASDILKAGFNDENFTLNVFRPTGEKSNKVLDLVYESLLIYSPESFRLTPWLADGQPQINTKDKTAVVKIKRNVEWSDGVELKADDVVFTAETHIENMIPAHKPFWEFIEKVEKIDERTIKYYFKEIRATFIHGTMLQPILPKHIWKPLIDRAVSGKSGRQAVLGILNINPVESQTVGTGPFVLKEWNKGQYISLVKNNNYHMSGQSIKGLSQQYRIGPYIDGIMFEIYSAVSDVVNSALRDNIDFILWNIDPDSLVELKEEKSLNITENAENSMNYIAFNVRKAPFSYRKFRQAMAWLIDKNYIVENILKGYGNTMSSVVPSSNMSYINENVEDYGTKQYLKREEREERARSLLSRAGFSWNSNDRLIDPEGKEVPPITILTPTADYDPLRAVCANVIADWWSSVGLTVNTRPASIGSIYEEVFSDRIFDVYILGWELSIFPYYIQEFFHSSNDVPGGSNAIGYSNRGFDILIDSFLTELDIAGQILKVKKLQDDIADYCPYIPLYNRTKIEVTSNRFEGWINQLNGIWNRWSLMTIRPN